jgi:hypothetical protein
MVLAKLGSAAQTGRSFIGSVSNLPSGVKMNGVNDPSASTCPSKPFPCCNWVTYQFSGTATSLDVPPGPKRIPGT